jgi:hypothetical protein
MSLTRSQTCFRLLRASVALMLLGSCDKGSSPAPSAVSASPSAAPIASSNPPAASAAVSATPATSAAWSGAYTAKVGAVDPPANAKEKTWVGDPGSAAVGKGTIELSIMAPRGDVSGVAKGPLGEMIVSGTYDGNELRANLAPNDPKAEDAMTGFLLLTGESTGPLKGTMRVSGRDARVVREASVEVSKK